MHFRGKQTTKNRGICYLNHKTSQSHLKNEDEDGASLARLERRLKDFTQGHPASKRSGPISDWLTSLPDTPWERGAGFWANVCLWMNFPFPEKSIDKVLRDNEENLFSTQMSSENVPLHFLAHWFCHANMHSTSVYFTASPWQGRHWGHSVCPLEACHLPKTKGQHPCWVWGSLCERLDNC